MLGSLFIVAAPSGAGKTSLVNALVEQQDNIALSISHTTRKARDGEVADKDYFFVSPRVFSNMRERGDFLESATVYDHSYGTSSEAVFEQLKDGIDVILEIDCNKMKQGRTSVSYQVEVSRGGSEEKGLIFSTCVSFVNVD